MTRAEIKHRFAEIVSFAEIEKFLDTPVKRYSSGMYVRLAFAVAAHLEPEILVVDEVLAVGDVQFQKKCLGKMKSVGMEGRTVLFVSHNLTAIRSLCNKAVMLKQGRLEAVGEVNQVIDCYLSGSRNNIISKEWHDVNVAPQNRSVMLRKLYICDNNRAPVLEINSDTAFTIVLEFSIKHNGASAGFTFVFYDKEKKLIFSSINNHERHWYGKPMPIGTYETICLIPANLLNNGWISIDILLFGKSYTDALTVPDVLSVEILDGPIVRGDFFGDYCAALRPMLTWNTLKLGKE
jgi:lipopolysaccharide transport system ATP-binding protein